MYNFEDPRQWKIELLFLENESKTVVCNISEVGKCFGGGSCIERIETCSGSIVDKNTIEIKMNKYHNGMEFAHALIETYKLGGDIVKDITPDDKEAIKALTDRIVYPDENMQYLHTEYLNTYVSPIFPILSGDDTKFILRSRVGDTTIRFIKNESE